MKCPYRFGEKNEECIGEKCHAYGKTLLLAPSNKRFLWGFMKQEFKPFPYCFALKTVIVGEEQ